jgi:hypothetical protein
MPCASQPAAVVAKLGAHGILLRGAAAADDDFRDHRHFAGTSLRLHGWRMEKSHGDAGQAVLVFYCMHARSGSAAAGQRV